MPDMFFKRLADKYGTENIRTGKYQQVIQDVLAYNNEKVTRRVFRMTNENYSRSLKRLPEDRAKIVKLPSDIDVIPKRANLIKSAESGKMISDTLRDQLQRNLRQTLAEYKTSGQYVSGRGAGKLNPQLIENFKKSITETFASRTQRDPSTGIPGNIRNIAVTEIRSVVDDVKAEYMNELERRNPQIEITKTWIHNKRLSKKPRPGHMRLHGVTIPKDKLFQVFSEDGKSFIYMDRPHDPDAGPDETIGCSCEVIYRVRIKEKVA